MGLRPDEFWSMTFNEVELACKGYELRLARSRELDRLIASILINANRKQGTKVVRPEDIMKLPTDRQVTDVDLMTKDEYIKAQELFNEVEWPKLT